MVEAIYKLGSDGTHTVIANVMDPATSTGMVADTYVKLGFKYTAGISKPSFDPIHTHGALDFFVDGKHTKSQWARIHASALSKVVVLARPVAYGQRLQRSDLTLMERSFSRLESFYTDPDRVVNLVAKRGLEAGQVLDASHLKTPRLVARNDVVTVIVQGRTFRISTLGKARDGGTLGDTIEVENLESHQLLRVEVIGNKTVRVLLPEEIG